RPIMLHTDQDLPIRTEPHGAGRPGVALQRAEALAPFASPVNLPQLDRAIMTATGQQPCGTAGQPPDPAAVSLQGTHAWSGFSPRPDLPQFHAAIKTAADEQPLRREGHGWNHVGVS